MKLSGINKLCKKCVNSCKQFEQVVIVRCPLFKRREDDNKKTSKNSSQNS